MAELLPPIYALLQMAVQPSLALFERIFEYLDLPHDIVDAPDAIAPRTRAGARGDQLAHCLVPLPLRQRIGPGRCALADLTLDIEPGQLPETRAPPPPNSRPPPAPSRSTTGSCSA